MTEITADYINNDDNSDMSQRESPAGSGDWTDQLTLNKMAELATLSATCG